MLAYPLRHKKLGLPLQKMDAGAFFINGWGEVALEPHGLRMHYVQEEKV